MRRRVFQLIYWLEKNIYFFLLTFIRKIFCILQFFIENKKEVIIKKNRLTNINYLDVIINTAFPIQERCEFDRSAMKQQQQQFSH